MAIVASFVRHLALLAGVVVAVSSAVNAKPTAPGRKAAALLAAEDARVQAQASGDIAAVETGLAEDLVYSHGNGRTQTKAEFLAGLRSNAGRPATITLSARNVRLYGSTGITHGTRHQQLGDRKMTDSYLAVYILRDRHWQLVAWQTTPLERPTIAETPTGK